MLKLMQYVNPEVRALRERFAIDTPRPGLLEWLAAPLHWLARWLDLLLMEKRKWTPLPWRHRLRAWRLGFTSFSYSLYELERNPPQDYLPDSAAIRRADRPNGRYNEAVFSKVVFSRMLKSLGAPQPPLLGVMWRGALFPEAGPPGDALAGLVALLESGRKLVLRPSYGGGGTGILFLQRSPDGWLVNSLPASAAELEELVRGLDDYLVTGFVEQAAYAREIFPGATNTLRILTLWDCEAMQPFIAAACHRFGRAGRGPLDNFHAGAGGTSVPIDIASGRLGRAVIRDGREIRRVAEHPDTGRRIEGVVVPGWSDAMHELLGLAARMPFAPCVGWDLVKLEDGWTCLEGNPLPGYHVWQVHGGVLRDPRARRFYREFEMLR